ncbi:hypothetical protein LZB31_09480, partial [Campylobacter jejuni]|nr:hypothetical protein [Campylobacter jejuni]
VAASAKGLEKLAAMGDLKGFLNYANMNTYKQNYYINNYVINKSYYSTSSLGFNNSNNNYSLDNKNKLNILGTTGGGDNIRNEFYQ